MTACDSGTLMGGMERGLGRRGRKAKGFVAAALFTTLAFPPASAAEEKSGRYSFLSTVGAMRFSSATTPLLAFGYSVHLTPWLAASVESGSPMVLALPFLPYLQVGGTVFFVPPSPGGLAPFFSPKWGVVYDGLIPLEIGEAVGLPLIATLSGGVDWTMRSRFVLRAEVGRWFWDLPQGFARIGLGSSF